MKNIKKSHRYQDKSTSGVKDLFKTKRLQLKCETKTADTRPANFKFQFSGTINIYLRDQNFYWDNFRQIWNHQLDAQQYERKCLFTYWYKPPHRDGETETENTEQTMFYMMHYSTRPTI